MYLFKTKNKKRFFKPFFFIKGFVLIIVGLLGFLEPIWYSFVCVCVFIIY